MSPTFGNHHSPEPVEEPAYSRAVVHGDGPYFVDFQQLKDDENLRQPDAREAFWNRVYEAGLPLWDVGSARATFLWRDPLTDGTPYERVHLYINRVTDKEHFDRGWMTLIEGTDIWAVTLTLAPTVRASYGILPLAAGQEPPTGPPRPGNRHTIPDPGAPKKPIDSYMSVLSGPLTPEQLDWECDQPLRGHSEEVVVNLPNHEESDSDYDPGNPYAKGDRPIYVYTPPTAADSKGTDGETSAPQDFPVLVVFDGDRWFKDFDLPVALEFAAERGALPPMIVVGIGNASHLDRVNALGGNREFLTGVLDRWEEIIQPILDTHGVCISPRAENRILAGQSLGGLSALVSAHMRPEEFGAYIAQSPSFWWRPGEKGHPGLLSDVNRADWITGLFATTQAPVEDGLPLISLAVGLNEGLSIPKCHRLQLTGARSGWSMTVNVYDGGHDFACWRGELITQLEDYFRHWQSLAEASSPPT